MRNEIDENQEKKTQKKNGISQKAKKISHF
jgi:hypothetical protein